MKVSLLSLQLCNQTLFLSSIWLVWIALCRHYSILVTSINYYHVSITAVSVQLWGIFLLWVSSSQQRMEWTQNCVILLLVPGASTVTLLVRCLKKSKIPAHETWKCVTERDRDLGLLLSWQERTCSTEMTIITDLGSVWQNQHTLLCALDSVVYFKLLTCESLA